MLSVLVWLGKPASAACEIETGADVAPGVPSLHARCTWPRASLAAARELLAAVDAHDRFVWTIAADHRIEEADGRALVHQRHEVPGVRAREARLWVWTEELADGGLRVAWTSDGRDFPLSDDALRPALSEGAWAVRPAVGGGVDLTFDLAYAPGGAVPALLVRWAQTFGAARVLADLERLSTPDPRSP